MHKSKIKQISLAVCLAFMPLMGNAAGLGKLNVNSGLGEPLLAEIDVISATPEELANLTASIASEEAYNVQGITRLGIHSAIKVELAKKADGSPVLKLRTAQPINDPYLDMLIQVDWTSGRLLREYTVLLDPPGYKASTDTTAIAAPTITNQAVNTALNAIDGNAKATTTKSKNKKAKQVAPAKQEPVATEESTTPQTESEVTTKRGDTLNAIARKMQVEGVSLDQMLAGLYENNKEAFAKDNMNQLKVGQILKVPSKEVLLATDEAQAKQTVKAHSSNWNAYRDSLASAVNNTPDQEESAPKNAASGKITSAVDHANPPKTGPQDVVKLSAGGQESAAANNKKAKEFDAKILALQEEATAREKALNESNDRIKALEKQIQDMQKLVDLKNDAMAALQRNAETKTPEVKTPDPAKPEVKPEVKAPEVKPVTEVKPVEVPPTETKAPEVKAPEVKAPEVKPAEVKPVQPKQPPVKSVKPKAPPPPVVEEPSLVDSVLSAFTDVNKTILGGVAGVVLLGAGWLFVRNKRRKTLDNFERGILTASGLRANTVFGNTTGGASASDTSFLTDFAQSADGSMIDTNDVDPIAEAEVYMAYGRDAQAEEILKDAITKEPQRYPLHLKLLEIYTLRKDTSAFEAIAGDLYATLGAEDPTWAKVAELGAIIEPDNPLYDLSKIQTKAPVAATNDTVAASDQAEARAADANADLDFTLDAPTQSASADDAQVAVTESFLGDTASAEQSQVFELGETDNASSVPSAAVEASTAAVDIEQVTQAVAAQVEAVQEDNTLEFELPEMDVKETSAAGALSFEAPQTDAAASLAPSSDALDMPMLDIERGDAEISFPSIDESAQAVADADDLSFELPEIVSLDGENEEISIDLPQVDLADLSEPETTPSAAEASANTFDLSSISLDLGDDEAKATADTAETNDLSLDIASESSASENQDVEIKLDLVAAYIDMDDKEGARELLEEVIKEGGPKQRVKAEQLLAGLA